jgi:formylmethanofuran dehydrogenase subunit E
MEKIKCSNCGEWFIVHPDDGIDPAPLCDFCAMDDCFGAPGECDVDYSDLHML